MEKVKNIGLRLQNERIRLGYTQGQIVEIAKGHEVAGATQNQISRWERGEQAVNIEFLSVLSEFGFDVNFVITGSRNRDFSEAIVRKVLERLDMPDLPTDMKTPEALLLGMRFLQNDFKPLKDDGTPYKLGDDTRVKPELKRKGRPPKVQVENIGQYVNADNAQTITNTMTITEKGKKK